MKPGRSYQCIVPICHGMGIFRQALGLKTDYIPAVTVTLFFTFFEEFGFLGASALIIIYLLLVYRGIRICLSTKNSYLSLTSLGLTAFLRYRSYNNWRCNKANNYDGVTLPYELWRSSML